MCSSSARRTAVMVSLLAVVLAALSPSPAIAAPVVWHPAPVPLPTPWTSMVRPDNALPDYPRPQMARTSWLNLNGLWDYLGRSGHPVLPEPPATYRDQILVPYPVESALSGVGRHDDEMWYRRTFRLPKGWQGQRVLLHFGAVDQIATVWVNSRRVSHHEGGYTEFSADITDALRGGGDQEIVVRAEDRNEAGPFSVGKQRSHPRGLFYTGASGIWQTVWMEPVPASHIEKLAIATDLTGLTVSPRIAGAAGERTVVFVSEPGGRVVGIGSGAAGQPIRVQVPRPHLWTPEDPYLYTLKVALVQQTGKVLDTVSSYRGLRTVGVVTDSRGRRRIAVNGRITFLNGVLDQGYWPDGIYTAPTDDALRSDLERVKQMGMNLVRKHAKVEPARWYYWADRIGLLVWQDMPSLDVSLSIPVGPAPDPPPAAKANFKKELLAMIDQLRNVTSIIAWVPFNEGWGEFDTARIAANVKAADPTRLVDANSGVNCCKTHGDTGVGDVYDDHTYVGPGHPRATPAGKVASAADRAAERRARVDGEYGGLGLAADRNRWPGRPESYEMAEDPARLTARYLEVSRALEDEVRKGGLSGAVYTQTTDVENEVNGLLSYDRKVVKMPIPVVAQRNRDIIATGGSVEQ